MTVPASLGYVMPAEWEPHSRCWMAWPCRDEVWGEHMDAARTAYADVARAIADFEPVTLVCNPADVAEASLTLGNGTAIDVVSMEIDDSWLRDSGPTFLLDRNGHLAGAHWRFNAWGQKYQPYSRDAVVAKQILKHVGARRFRAPFVLEGGAVHVDGEGTVLTTEQCLLNPNRNPDLTKAQVEQNLRDWLGVSTVIWLPEGIEDDETDGHVDEIACFVRPGVVLALSTDDKSDGNFDVLQTNLDILRSAKDAKGRPLQVIEVPQPARQEHNGKRLSLSYVNFYIANGGIVMPAFDVAEDERAFRIIRDAFPNRRVVQVHARDIFLGGGGIHCITQQQPSP
ncbi:agmatine deiminase [Inquilinus limosus]|uniref:Putative agmatine deiminase n=1 Tax=Inquilinus limosus TaxID=171674 RepID=A0A211ZQS8_9PROT|nr:agmatine deiminase [Inquilinus limosus]OWJ67600.1 agmatine deiminase [Inquilinus limosus]